MTFSQFHSAAAAPTPQEPPASHHLSGCRLYSPLVLALSAILGNLPLSTALLGINFRRRGRRILGNVAIVVSVILALLLIAYAYTSPDPRGFRLFNFVGGLLIFAVERPAFRTALQEGAVRAKWWPPWLLLIGIAAIFFLADLWFH